MLSNQRPDKNPELLQQAGTAKAPGQRPLIAATGLWNRHLSVMPEKDGLKTREHGGTLLKAGMSLVQTLSPAIQNAVSFSKGADDRKLVTANPGIVLLVNYYITDICIKKETKQGFLYNETEFITTNWSL